ncbi:hypothetical protein [Listeria booriae]|nr:hypothetical protein [Listeria booriae]
MKKLLAGIAIIGILSLSIVSVIPNHNDVETAGSATRMMHRQ